LTDPDARLKPSRSGGDERSRSGNAPSTGRSAFFVAVGIFCSRLIGLVRQRVIAHYFGLETDAADAWAAGFRIPNFLQNLFGEGALSASFIPVYASLVARGRRQEADRVAGAVASLLALVVSGIVAVGVFATPWLIDAVAPGFVGAKRELTIQVVRILFPGAGLLVLSAWCLGVLNSHHRFLLAYTAPVLWSLAMIAGLLWFGEREGLPRLVAILAWSSVVGSGLQFAVQVPVVLRVAPDLRFTIDTASAEVRTVVRNFVPAFIGRGVVQVSAYVDTLLASLLPTGAVAGLLNAQTLYTLPVSLFGMSVSAAELPAMSGEVGVDAAGFAILRRRLDAGLRQIAFFVVPSAMAFLALGDVVAAALLQTGRFSHADALRVWGILAGSAVGLLASTLGRLYSSTYYALRDTRTPLGYAVVRIVLTTVLGYVFAIPLPHWLGVPASWGTAGLTASAGIAGWVEMLLLRSAMNARIGRTGLPAEYVAKLWGSAAAAAAIAWAVKLAIPTLHPIATAALVLGPYGLVFYASTLALRIPEASTTMRRVARLGRR
jgi:putative peptidoglycan lipid II flippase